MARILVEIPVERYRILSEAGRAPLVGDIVTLDQGFSRDDGLSMGLVYCPSEGDNDLYEADVYESELDDVPPQLSSKLLWSPIPNEKEIGREKAFQRRADHRLLA